MNNYLFFAVLTIFTSPLLFSGGEITPTTSPLFFETWRTDYKFLGKQTHAIDRKKLATSKLIQNLIETYDCAGKKSEPITLPLTTTKELMTFSQYVDKRLLPWDHEKLYRIIKTADFLESQPLLENSAEHLAHWILTVENYLKFLNDDKKFCDFLARLRNNYNVEIAVARKIIDIKRADIKRLLTAINTDTLKTFDVNILASAHDSAHVLLVDTEGIVRRMNVSDGHCGEPLTKIPTTVLTSFVLSPQGAYIYGTSEGCVCIKTGNRLIKVLSHGGSITALDANAHHIVSASSKGTIKVWDAETYRLLRKIYDVAMYAVAITPDGKQIISGSWDDTIKIWDMATGDLVKILKEHTSKKFVDPVYDERIYDTDFLRTTLMKSPKKTNNVITLWDNYTKIRKLVLTADGKYIVSKDSNTIKFWDLHTGALIYSFDSFHKYGCDELVITPNGKYLFYQAKLYESSGNIERYNIKGFTTMLQELQTSIVKTLFVLNYYKFMDNAYPIQSIRMGEPYATNIFNLFSRQWQDVLRNGRRSTQI